MPQELALFPEFTIAETLRYFGQLYRMSAESIAQRSEAISKVLHLPDTRRPIKQLSGGQQRRVSLSCALIHRPPLLILDEPTVGVDPLLRVSIWAHLESLCRDQAVTVILTTHYIEEARGAATIGLLRNGALLVEGNPEVLMAQHNLPRLEDVYLKLSMLQDDELNAADKVKPSSNGYTASGAAMKRSVVGERNPPVYSNRSSKRPTKKFLLDKWSTHFDLYHFMALFTKNCLCLRRNLKLTLFYCLIPTLQFTLFMFSASKTPTDIPVAIVNEESPPILTAKFLSFLNSSAITQIHMNSVEEGERTVIEGKTWAMMHFRSNFSAALNERRLKLASADPSVIAASNVHLSIDMTNKIVGSFVLYNGITAYRSLIFDFLRSFGYNPQALSVPMEIKVVHGTLDITSMAELITPGFLILIAFFSTAAVTGLSLIAEQKDGLLDRSLVAGVKPLEVLVAQISAQILVLIGQQVLLFLTIFFLFAVPSRGPIIWVFTVCFLQGISGIMYGLFISTLIPDEVSASIITISSFLPILMLSGIIWPAQSISVYLHWVSQLLPQTLAIESLRSVLSRGWTLLDNEVWLGIWASASWTLIYLLLAVFFFNKLLT